MRVNSWRSPWDCSKKTSVVLRTAMLEQWRSGSSIFFYLFRIRSTVSSNWPLSWNSNFTRICWRSIQMRIEIEFCVNTLFERALIINVWMRFQVIFLIPLPHNPITDSQWRRCNFFLNVFNNFSSFPIPLLVNLSKDYRIESYL